MKKVEFDLEKAKAGAKLVTRDGQPVRIICWDFKNKNYPIDDYPIIAAIDEDGGESLCFYTNRGHRWSEINKINSCYDLFILEESTYRPYVCKEEFLNNMKEHGPMLLNVDNDCYYTISRLDADEVFVRDTSYNYDLLKELYKWQDGHPCGAEEEN